MAMNPVSSSLPALPSSPHVESQPWFQWSVSAVFITAFVGFVCAFFLAFLYRIVSALPKKTAKLIPYPQNELSTLCFISIDPSSIPNRKTLRHVKVIIEDTQERRIATRYLPDESPLEIIAHLPLDKEIKVHVESARNAREGVEIRPIFSSQVFKVNDTVRIHLHSNKTLLEAISWSTENNAPWHPADKKANHYLSQRGVKVDFSSKTKFEDEEERHSMTLIGKNQIYKAVKITLIHTKDNNLFDIFLYYPVINGETRKLNFSLLIEDWKAAYRLRTGKEFSNEYLYEHFYIDAIEHRSYRASSV